MKDGGFALNHARLRHPQDGFGFFGNVLYMCKSGRTTRLMSYSTGLMSPIPILRISYEQRSMTISHRITMALLWRTSIDSPGSRCQGFFWGVRKMPCRGGWKTKHTSFCSPKKNITWKLSLLLPNFLPLHSPGSSHKNIPKSYGKQKTTSHLTF